MSENHKQHADALFDLAEKYGHSPFSSESPAAFIERQVALLVEEIAQLKTALDKERASLGMIDLC